MEKDYSVIRGDKFFKFGEGFRIVECTENGRIIDVGYGEDITEWANYKDVSEEYLTYDEAKNLVAELKAKEAEGDE